MQAIHAAISGALAIDGVPPYPIRLSVGAAFQCTSFNTTDGGYEILEGEHRELLGHVGGWSIPAAPGAPRSLSEIASFVLLAGVGDVDLDMWWETDGEVSLEGETAEAAVAAHLFMTTEVKRIRKCPKICRSIAFARIRDLAKHRPSARGAEMARRL